MSAGVGSSADPTGRIAALMQYRRKLNEHRELDEKLKQGRQPNRSGFADIVT
jgi:hypothetical protein